MKWITHQTGAILAASALALPLPGIAAAWAGAIIPDVIDQSIGNMGLTRRQKQKLFNKVHRGSSHWFGWWILLFCGALAAPLPLEIRVLTGGLALGGISHIMLDMLTPQGIPLKPFSRTGKLAVPICATGKWSEYLFLGLMILGAAIYWGGEYLYQPMANFLDFLK